MPCGTAIAWRTSRRDYSGLSMRARPSRARCDREPARRAQSGKQILQGPRSDTSAYVCKAPRHAPRAAECCNRSIIQRSQPWTSHLPALPCWPRWRRSAPSRPYRPGPTARARPAAIMYSPTAARWSTLRAPPCAFAAPARARATGTTATTTGCGGWVVGGGHQLAVLPPAGRRAAGAPRTRDRPAGPADRHRQLVLLRQRPRLLPLRAGACPEGWRQRARPARRASTATTAPAGSRAGTTAIAPGPTTPTCRAAPKAGAPVPRQPDTAPAPAPPPEGRASHEQPRSAWPRLIAPARPARRLRQPAQRARGWP